MGKFSSPRMAQLQVLELQYGLLVLRAQLRSETSVTGSLGDIILMMVRARTCHH